MPKSYLPQFEWKQNQRSQYSRSSGKWKGLSLDLLFLVEFSEICLSFILLTCNSLFWNFWLSYMLWNRWYCFIFLWSKTFRLMFKSLNIYFIINFRSWISGCKISSIFLNSVPSCLIIFWVISLFASQFPGMREGKEMKWNSENLPKKKKKLGGRLKLLKINLIVD